MKFLSFDPSGSHGKSGDGTTGWAIFHHGELDSFGAIKAKDFKTQEEYFLAVSNFIVQEKPDFVVCETYRLFAHKAKQQSWSEMDTPQLIGHIRMTCFAESVPIKFQDPSLKTRVTDEILVKQKVFSKEGTLYYCMGNRTNLHERDAIRHGIYFTRYNNIS